VEWVDLGAQWDNIPAEDDLPGYDADQSRALAKAAAEMVKKPIADPELAFRTRCTECHNMRYVIVARSKKKVEADWLETLERMNQKRSGWIHDSEMPSITAYVLEHYFNKPK